ncbi:hypothetical protein [Oryzibacter oryziterrae]|uniref:hypothetical protein n=1 Tax=Oryzibacter oryziterrae TaxID=2766474 RepID=UPI001F25E5F1|nr:hypothetical protein [Oryzibacter oryziterrae]
MGDNGHFERRSRIIGRRMGFVRAVSGATSLEYAVVGGVLALLVSTASSYSGHGLSDGLQRLKAAISGTEVEKVAGHQLIGNGH